MRETTQAAQGFGNSVAFFDDAGRLLDWTPDFEIEFAAAAPLIGPGASLRSLIAAAYGDDETSLADLAAHSQFDPSRPWADDDAVAKASPRAFDLHRRSGVILRVQEEPSRSGGLVRTARDVTADRRFTGTLFDGEKRWRLDGDPTLEVVSHVNIKPDGHHRPSPFPEEIRRLWGLDAEADISDLPAMFSRLVLTKEEQRHFDATWEHLARTLQPAWLMYRVRDCNGRLTWIEIAITGEREEDGGAFLTLRHRDITREKLAENQLELLQSAVTHASDSIQIVRTSAEGVTTTAYVNPAFEQTTGWRAEELVGRPVTVMDGWGEAYWDRLQALVTDADESVIEVQIQQKSGTMAWLEASAKVVGRSSNGSIRWVVVSRNIDARRRVQEDLYRARDEAEAANRAKSEFLANMSHEIRTPMNGVMGMNALLLRTALTPDQKKFAHAVKVSAESLLGILNDILDVSKLEAGRVELENVDFCLEKIVEDVVELLSTKAQEKGLEIACYVDDVARRPLRGDPTRLRQIILNLLSNSVKFTERGFVSLEARAFPLPDGRMTLKVEVHDTGIGLSPEAKAKLFQKFQQADGSITRRFGGTGLGLSICRQLVELMGGHIGVDDRSGGGATFWFEVALEPAAAALSSPPERRSLVGARILVVDDIEMNRCIFMRQLEAEGGLVEEADSGEMGLAAMARAEEAGAPFDLILLDHMMPEMAGDEMAERIRARTDWRQPKLVLASSIGAPLSTDRAAVAGFDAFLTKPVRCQNLIDCLEDLLRAAISTRTLACEPSADAPAEEDLIHVRGRVLLAEDNEINTLLAVSLLEQAGYRVDCVVNGAEAVQAVRQQAYDLILMDIQMPVMGGLEATRQIRGLDSTAAFTPIVAMTANAMLSDQEACRNAGMDDYVSKPFDPEEFLNVVAALADPHTSQATRAA